MGLLNRVIKNPIARKRLKRLKEMKRLLKRTRESFFPVVDEETRLVGILPFPDLRAVLFEEALSDLIVVHDLVEKPVSIGLNETLYEP